jgi:hypothetical protein
MNRLQYRRFSDGHESLVANHTVGVGSSSDQAAIRWYEIRNLSSTPTIYQQGTYAPGTDSRWMGSIAMDQVGDIALGYSVSSSTVSPSIRYTGRLASDPLGSLPQGEATLIAGSGSQTASQSRWGDYSMMAIDPTDDCTFWYTQEYYANTSIAGWQTRVGSFKFPNCVPPLTISSVQASNINASSVVVTWLTSNSANSRVDYGTTAGYGSSVSDPSSGTTHSVTLNGLTNDTTYHFKSTSTDAFAQSVSSSDATFVTHTNLLSNGGFEAGAAGWILAPQASIDTNPADAHSGNISAQLVATGPWQVVRQTLSVSPGQAYAFSAWGRSSSNGGYFIVRGYDTNGNPVTSLDLPFPGTGSWVSVAGVHVTTANEVTVQVQGTSATSGTFWFDDVSLSPTSNLITNGGFEAGSLSWSLAPQASIDTNPVDAHSGNKSAQLVATGPWQVVRQTFSVSPGQAYAFSAWGRSSSNGGYFIVRGYDTNGNPVASLDLPFPGTGSWVSVAGVHVAAANEVTVQIQGTSANGGTFWFDDFSLSRS